MTGVQTCALPIYDVATTDPYILTVWDFEKNDAIGIKPTSVKAGSLKRAFMKCLYCGYSTDYQVRDVVKRRDTIKCNACKHKFFGV